MKKKMTQIKVGTGITQKPAWILGGVVDDESRRASDELARHQKRNSGLLSERAKRAAAELNGGTAPPPGTKNWDDPTVTPEEHLRFIREWYAREIVSKADDMLTFLDMANQTMGAKLTEKDIHAVLVAAYGLGRLTKEAEIKFQWEPDALRGHKLAETLRDVASYHNFQRQQEADVYRSEWQEAANAIWGRRPSLSAKEVGKLVANECGGNPDTIRRKIKRPPK